jgi:hypothetical protein
VIELGGQPAAIVPLTEVALERHASAEALEVATVEAATADYDSWVAVGCPGALSHAEVAASLLTQPE